MSLALNFILKIRIAGIIEDSVVDGAGLRLTVFAQGCSRHCLGCHNPTTHDYNGGYEIDTQEIIKTMNANPLLDGLSISGGEPFDQPEGFYELAKLAKSFNYHVMAWSGYKFEDLIKDFSRRRMLEYIDVLIDGEFILKLRSLNLKWRGSSNQRVIDVPASLLKSEAVLLKII